MKPDEDRTDELLDRLDTLITIQALSAVSHLQTKKEKTLFLAEAGLAPKAIAPIVGTSPASVSQTIYESRKAKSGGKNG